MNRTLPALLLLTGLTGACTGSPPEQQPLDPQAPRQQAPLERWQDARFGLFVHWGPIALEGTEIGWSRGAQVPRERYDQLYRDFNPVLFDADEWARTAREAGMGYVVLTSKHHDGFCLWDSALTEYDIMATPFGRDVVAELSAACRREGLDFGLYYSILDWYQPDYNTADSYGGPGAALPQGATPSMDRYQDYLHAQLRELVEGYGPLFTLWFDGEWEDLWTHERGQGLEAFCRELQPDVLINNRVGKDRQGMGGTTAQSATNPGDYDTPEQRVGAFQAGRPWETCMTLCTQWAWKPEDEMKSLDECIETLVRTAGGNGNLLFNVGPMPDGRIEPRQVERLREIGRWLELHGETIYGTRGGPFYPDRWGASTHRGSTVWVHLLDRDEEQLLLPGLEQRVLSARVTTGGQVEFEQGEQLILLSLTDCDPEAVDTIVELELDGPVTGMATLTRSPTAYDLGQHGAWLSRAATFEASSTAEKWSHDEDKLLSGEPYAGDYSFHSAKEVGPWIVVDLGEVALVRGLEITNRQDESHWDRTSTLAVWVSEGGDNWQEVWRASEGRPAYEISIDPGVPGRYVKLGLTDEEPGYLHLKELRVFGDRL